jgi:hypothetical protein
VISAKILQAGWQNLVKIDDISLYFHSQLLIFLQLEKSPPQG